MHEKNTDLPPPRKGGRPRKEGHEIRPRLRLSGAALAVHLSLSPEDASATYERALLSGDPLRVPGPTAYAVSRGVVIRPQRPLCPEVATLSIERGALFILLTAKRDDFRAVVKDRLDCTWDGTSRWTRPLPARAGDPQDRLAEAASVLLDHRFTVRVPNDRIAEMVQEGAWVPEQRRWMDARKKKVLLTWERGNDALYAAIKRLPGYEWSRGDQGALIPAQYFADLRDFAAHRGFQITPEAEALLRHAEANQEEVLLYSGRRPTRPEPPPAPPAPPTGEVTVPAHLRLDD